MNDKWVIAIDQGTSSCRAFAVDNKGQVRAQQSKVFSPQRPQKGLSFYDAEQLLRAQLEVLHALLDEIGPEKAAALAVCSQRSSIVLWDKNTSRPLAPVLTWEDGRSVKESQTAPLSQEEIHNRTGLFKTPYFSAPKITWCLNNYPLAKEAAQTGTLQAAPIASYLIWHLTGGRVFATDPTLAQRTLLWNIQTGQWSETLCKAFGVPLSCLPLIQPTVANYGVYQYKGISIPICVCVADQQAAAAYYNLSVGQTMVNYGTGAFVLHHTGNKLSVIPGMLSSVAISRSLADKQFLLEGPIFSAGSLFEWLKTKGIEVRYDCLDSLALSAKFPVVLLPALGGVGAPYWDYHVQHVVIDNGSQRPQPEDWVAGIFRSIAARVADIIYYLRLNGFVINAMLVSGGLSKNMYLLQRQADIVGVPLEQWAETESSVFGAAHLAADYLNWDVTAWSVSSIQTITPQFPFKKSQEEYHDWQQFIRRQLHL